MTMSDELFEHSPAMLWHGDATGRCVRLNAAQREFWGVQADRVAKFDWSSTLLLEDRPLVEGPFGEGMREHKPFTCEARYRRADGTVRLLRTRANPLFDDAGRFLGMVGINEDVTELRVAQADLAAANADLKASLREAQTVMRRFEQATSIAGLSMSEHDADLRYVWAHGIPNSSIGRTPSEIIGGQLGDLLDEFLRSALHSKETVTKELEFSVDGRRQWWEVQACRLPGADDRGGVLASAFDVTARRLNEQKLEVLARELSHRVKNVYAVVQAIVYQAAKVSGVPGDFVDKLSDRLRTLAAAQDGLLAAGRDYVDMHELSEQTLGHVENVDVTGPEVRVPARVAPYVALALHELATNSLKYGALQKSRRATFEWTLEDGDQMSLEWIEPSDRKAPSTDHTGFGTLLLSKIFARATGGQAARSWDENGLKWTARLPLRAEITM
jgi:PAS domain S-box-containing protein